MDPRLPSSKRPAAIRTHIAPALIAFLILACRPAATLGQVSLPTPEEKQFASLNSVFFVDAERGWSVGDRGAIWHSSDGGRNWRLQVSPVGCALNSVCFVDAKNGWAVGGWMHHASPLSSGLVLRTTDGGQQWHRVENLTLPKLQRVKFFDLKRGWAWGDPSGLFPTGVFTTDDGGRTWTPLPGPMASNWIAGDVNARSLGCLINEQGQQFDISPAGLQLGTALKPVAARPSVLNIGEKTAWMAGEGGWLRRSSNSGKTWETVVPFSAPSNPLAADLDFHTLAVIGPHVFLAGSPGSCIVHSPDDGQTWELQPTNHFLPLKSIHFVSASQGWAVGAAGAILATRDGGKSWRRQRGGERIALLAVSARPLSLPLELLARTCEEEGVLAAVETLYSPAADAAPACDNSAEKMRAACLELGAIHAAQAWAFPVPESISQLPDDRIIATWNRGNCQGPAALEEHLVKLLRQWRPEVLVLDSSENASHSSLDPLAASIGLQAAQSAADHATYPQHFAQHLAPWRVTKVFAASPPGASAPLNITTSQFALRHATTLAHRAQCAANLISSERRPRVPQIAYRILVDHTGSERGPRELFGGLSSRVCAELRCHVGDPQLTNLEALKQITLLGPQIDAWSREGEPLTDPEAWLAHVEKILSNFDADTAAMALFELGHVRRRYDPQSAALALELLARRFPHHPLAEASNAWLMRYYTSSETNRATDLTLVEAKGVAFHREPTSLTPPTVENVSLLRQLGPQVFGDQPFAPRRTDFIANPSTPSEPTPNTKQSNSPESAATTNIAPSIHVPKNREARLSKALEVVDAIQKFHPALFASSDTRLLHAAAARASGNATLAEGKIESLASRRGIDPYRASAQGEQWLIGRTPVSPKFLLRCEYSATRPRLDGQLDDAIWQTAGKIDLRSPFGDDLRWPAVALFAHDSEHLYFATQCAKAPGIGYPPPTTTRSRDANLTANDRIELRIDVDRDYATFFRLVIDYRGFALEDCFDNVRWNPKWFVASASDEHAWRIEAAIPLSELGDAQTTLRQFAAGRKPIDPNPAPTSHALPVVWGIGIERLAPNVGRQSFPPAGIRSLKPEGFGYLELNLPNPK